MLSSGPDCCHYTGLPSEPNDCYLEGCSCACLQKIIPAGLDDCVYVGEGEGRVMNPSPELAEASLELN